MRTLFTWLLVPLAAGVLLAGCGSSSSSSTSGSTSSTAAGSTTPSTTSSTKSPTTAAAVESCRRGAKAIPTLSSSTRIKIEAICEKAANDPGQLRTAAREVCEEIVKASPLPEGSAKQHAIAGCKSAEKQK
jgi:hypothetical protein